MVPVGIWGGRLIYKVIFKTPYYFLVPTISLATILGTFALRNSVTDVLIMITLGTIGYLLKQVGIAPAPIVLGLILGSIAEIGFVQSLLRGAAYPYPILKLFENPLSHILIAMTLFSGAWPYLSVVYKRFRSKKNSR